MVCEMITAGERSFICKDTFITDFTDPLFEEAFKKYFSELEITVKDWDGLFQEMNDDEGVAAVIRTAEDGSVMGFIMYQPIQFTSWFFEETRGFIREFCIAKEYRNLGHGSQLLKLVEDEFIRQGIRSFILTTDTAEDFYLNHGYKTISSCTAKNKDRVFIKISD